jgi:mono/diheme cytochrome c family protein
VTTRRLSVLIGIAVIATCSFAGATLARTAARPGDPEAGRKIFKQFCAQCHNFRATASQASAAMVKAGHAGSDLDVLKPSYPRTVTAIVQGEGGLAAEYFLRRMTFKQIYDVASFVAKYAGKPAPPSASKRVKTAAA